MKSKNNKIRDWYQGTGNIISILAFISGLWPLAIILMWFLATWSRRIKLALTLVPVLLMASIYLGLFIGQGSPLQNPQSALTLSRNIINFSVIAILISLIFSITATIFSEKMKIDNKKIWLYEGILLIILVAVAFFFAMRSVGIIYSITR